MFSINSNNRNCDKNCMSNDIMITPPSLQNVSTEPSTAVSSTLTNTDNAVSHASIDVVISISAYGTFQTTWKQIETLQKVNRELSLDAKECNNLRECLAKIQDETKGVKAEFLQMASYLNQNIWKDDMQSVNLLIHCIVENHCKFKHAYEGHRELKMAEEKQKKMNRAVTKMERVEKHKFVPLRQEKRKVLLSLTGKGKVSNIGSSLDCANNKKSLSFSQELCHVRTLDVCAGVVIASPEISNGQVKMCQSALDTLAKGKSILEYEQKENTDLNEIDWPLYKEKLLAKLQLEQSVRSKYKALVNGLKSVQHQIAEDQDMNCFEDFTAIHKLSSPSKPVDDVVGVLNESVAVSCQELYEAQHKLFDHIKVMKAHNDNFRLKVEDSCMLFKAELDRLDDEISRLKVMAAAKRRAGGHTSGGQVGRTPLD